MKLIEASRAARHALKVSIDEIAQKQLVVVVQQDNTYYVISDVPPISEDQFSKLLDISFEEGSVDSIVHDLGVIDLYRTEATGIEWSQMSGPDLMNASIKTLTWKQFVAEFKAEWPHEEQDDFDE